MGSSAMTVVLAQSGDRGRRERGPARSGQREEDDGEQSGGGDGLPQQQVGAGAVAGRPADGGQGEHQVRQDRAEDPASGLCQGIGADLAEAQAG
jgi:hypothetical protein